MMLLIPDMEVKLRPYGLKRNSVQFARRFCADIIITDTARDGSQCTNNDFGTSSIIVPTPVALAGS
jgi:hypothetical protein